MTIQTLHHRPARLLSDRQVAHRLGITSQEFATLELDSAAFPEPVELTPEICCWLEHEVDDYIELLAWRRNHRNERRDGQAMRAAAQKASQQLAARIR